MNAPGEVALECAQRFFARLAIGFTPCQIRARRRVDARLGDRDAVQRQVQLAIAFAIQTMPLLLTRGSIKRSDAGELGELPVGGEAIDTGHLGDQLGGCERAASRQGEQLRRLRFDERAQLALEPVGSAREL